MRFRREEISRALVVSFTASLLLYFGMPTFGWILRFVPLIDNIPLERFILAVHLSGIFLAARGVRWILGLVRQLAPAVVRTGDVAWAPTAAVLVVGALVFVPVWTKQIALDRQGGAWVAGQLDADALDGAGVVALIDRIRALGGGRTYAGLRANWGGQYKVGSATVYSILANHDVDAIGFTLRTPTLSSNIEVRFDENNPANYDMLNVRYLLLPADRKPPVQAEFVARAGRHTLWQRETSGYIDVVDTSGTITADRATLGPAMTEFLRSDRAARGVYPTVAFNDRPAAEPTRSGSSLPDSPAGRVTDIKEDPQGGVYTATIRANRKAVVLLKSSFDPGWTVEIDGKSMPGQMIGPSLVGRTVEAGRHEVRFVYNVVPYHWFLFLLGLITIAVLWVHQRRASRSSMEEAVESATSNTPPLETHSAT
jgi:hypothetical protein